MSVTNVFRAGGCLLNHQRFTGRFQRNCCDVLNSADARSQLILVECDLKLTRARSRRCIVTLYTGFDSIKLLLKPHTRFLSVLLPPGNKRQFSRFKFRLIFFHKQQAALKVKEHNRSLKLKNKQTKIISHLHTLLSSKGSSSCFSHS